MHTEIMHTRMHMPRVHVCKPYLTRCERSKLTLAGRKTSTVGTTQTTGAGCTGVRRIPAADQPGHYNAKVEVRGSSRSGHEKNSSDYYRDTAVQRAANTSNIRGLRTAENRSGKFITRAYDRREVDWGNSGRAHHSWGISIFAPKSRTGGA